MSRKVLYTFHPQKGITRISCCEDEQFKVVNTNYGPVIYITVDDFGHPRQDAGRALYKFISNEFMAFCPSGYDGHRVMPITIGRVNECEEIELSLGVRLYDRHETYIFTNGIDGRSTKFKKFECLFSHNPNTIGYDPMNETYAIWRPLPGELHVRAVSDKFEEFKRKRTVPYYVPLSKINDNLRTHSADGLDGLCGAYLAHDEFVVNEAFHGGLVAGDYGKYTPNRVIQNGPATIVFWLDGTKTIVKREKNTPNDLEAAFSAALAKKMYGTNSHIKRILKNVTDEE